MGISTFSVLVVFSFVLYFNELSIAGFNADLMTTDVYFKLLFGYTCPVRVTVTKNNQLDINPFLCREISRK